MNEDRNSLNLHCPVGGVNQSDCVMLAHGEGGLMMRRLIRDRILSRLPALSTVQSDSADVGRIDGAIAISILFEMAERSGRPSASSR